MTRTGLFQLTIVVLLICAAISGLLWWYIQQTEVRLQQLNANLDEKRTELANLSQMTEAQEKLDKLTLDEKQTTQLALLRHLELENMPINFTIGGREDRATGDTTLIIRTINIQNVNSFAEQMGLLDKLYGNGKLQIKQVSIMKVDNAEVSDATDMTIEGFIYSLDKMNVPEAETPTEHVAPVEGAAQVSPTAGNEGVVE